jgi:hypothetical protein
MGLELPSFCLFPYAMLLCSGVSGVFLPCSLPLLLSYCFSPELVVFLRFLNFLPQSTPEANHWLVGANPAFTGMVQPMIDLCVAAYPGPSSQPTAGTAATVAQAHNPSGIDFSAEQVTPGWVYKNQTLQQISYVAGVLADVIATEVWSLAVGSPGSVLKANTPRSVLKLLQEDSTKRLLTYNVLVVTTRLYKQRRGGPLPGPDQIPDLGAAGGPQARAAGCAAADRTSQAADPRPVHHSRALAHRA